MVRVNLRGQSEDRARQVPPVRPTASGRECLESKSPNDHPSQGIDVLAPFCAKDRERQDGHHQEQQDLRMSRIKSALSQIIHHIENKQERQGPRTMVTEETS